MKVNENAEDLLMDIVKCGFGCGDEKSPCHSIWKSQGCADLGEFQLPEPWNGDIENAKLVFFAINPHLSNVEMFPRSGNDWWMDGATFCSERVIDFFKNRFCSRHEYVKHNNGRSFRVKLENGKYKSAGSGVWQYMHKLARLILEDTVTPGRDYALTEIVHCKTVNVNGLTDECCDECKNKWMERVLKVSKSLEYVVVLGEAAIKRIADVFSISTPQKYKWYSVEKYGRSFKVLFGYHSSWLGRGRGRTYESFQKVFNANQDAGIGVSILPEDLKRR